MDGSRRLAFENTREYNLDTYLWGVLWVNGERCACHFFVYSGITIEAVNFNSSFEDDLYNILIGLAIKNNCSYPIDGLPHREFEIFS